MDEFQKMQFDFLKNEYSQMSEMFKTYWNSRLTLLFLFLSIIGTIIGVIFNGIFIEKKPQSEYIYFELGTFLIIAIMIKILSTISRSIYLFIFRMKDIAQLFKVQDFWTIIPRYFELRKSEAGTFMYYIVCHLMNLLFLAIYMFLNSAYFSFSVSFLTPLVFVILITGYNIWSTEKGLNVHRFLSINDASIIVTWEQAKKQAL